MAQAIAQRPNLTARISASPRKLLALALGHGLAGAAVFCAAYAGNLIISTGGVDCASFGMLILAGPAGILGVMAGSAAEKNLS